MISTRERKEQVPGGKIFVSEVYEDVKEIMEFLDNHAGLHDGKITAFEKGMDGNLLVCVDYDKKVLWFRFTEVRDILFKIDMGDTYIYDVIITNQEDGIDCTFDSAYFEVFAKSMTLEVVDKSFWD